MKSTLRQILITALVAALVGGATSEAAKTFITGKQIKNGSVRGKDVKFPRAMPIRAGAGVARARMSATVGDQFEQIAVMGTYDKRDGAAVLRLDWTGSAIAPSSPCVFQLRVDGQPGTGGEAYVFSLSGVVAAGLFTVDAGVHEVEMFARVTQTGNTGGCELGGDIPQQITATEVIQ